MREFGVADLHDAGQRVALLVDVAHARLGGGFPRHHLHAVVRLHRIERRHVLGVEEPASPSAVIGIGPVQSGEVGGIGAVLDEVVPVVVVVARRLDASLAAGLRQRRVLRQRGLVLPGRPEIAEDQSAKLPHRIGEVLHLLVEHAAGRLCRLLEAGSAHIEEPSVIWTPKPGGLHVAVLQGCPAVRAVKTQQAQPPLAVAEQHKILSENPDPDRNIPKVARAPHHHPVASEPLPGGRASPHVGEVRHGQHSRTSLGHGVTPLRHSGTRRSFRHPSVIPAPVGHSRTPPSFPRKRESRGGGGVLRGVSRPTPPGFPLSRE